MDSSYELFSLVLSTFVQYLNRGSGQSFNTVTPSLAKLCCVAHNLQHKAPSSWNISHSSKSGIKLSFGNWMYLAQFTSLSILTNFFWTITFYMSQKLQTLTPKLHCFCQVMWVVSLSWRPYLLECRSILVSLLNMILFQTSASHNS